MTVGFLLFSDSVLESNLQHAKRLHAREVRDAEHTDHDNCEHNHSHHLVSATLTAQSNCKRSDQNHVRPI
jgi:hypothetical protein